MARALLYHRRMSWLNASEAFLMDSAVREHIDDLRSTIAAAPAPASAAPIEETRRDESVADAPAHCPRAAGASAWRRLRAACL